MVVVAMDVDGVIADFDSHVSELLGIDLHSGRTVFNTAVDYGDAVHGAIGQLLRNPSFWVSLPPMPGARESLRRLRRGLGRSNIPFEIRFYSSLPHHYEGLRRWWLWKVVRAAENMDAVYLRTPRHATKGDFIMADHGGVDYYIDDRSDTVDTVIAKGATGFVHPAPWNSGYEGPARVGTLSDFVNAVLLDLSTK